MRVQGHSQAVPRVLLLLPLQHPVPSSLSHSVLKVSAGTSLVPASGLISDSGTDTWAVEMGMWLTAA